MAFAETLHPLIRSLSLSQYVALGLVGSILATILYCTYIAVYNLWFHPLSKYPGPRLAAISPLWTILSYYGGKTPTDLLALHDRYGPVVRTSPDALSYINPAQWREIYARRGGARPEFAKDPKYFAGIKGEPIIINADHQQHVVMRRLISSGFAEKALQEQESILRQYVDVLFRRLHEESCNGRQAINMVNWYNFFTFDFVGFLTFGESFDCLTNSALHRWVMIFFSVARSLSYHQISSRLPYLLRLPFQIWAIPASVKSDLKTISRLNAEKIKYRLGKETTIPDFTDKLVEAYNSGKMSYKQLEGNTQILIAAGSETTATLMAGLTWYLLQNPAALRKLNDEIRTTFSSPEEITVAGVNSCAYMLSCIEEALRLYPPSPQPHHRIVPAGGATINGEYIPAGMSVSIPIYAASRSPQNWARPASFAPERWASRRAHRDDGGGGGGGGGGAGDEDIYRNDKHEASQPFSCGPRDCIGRNLAYAEIKLVFARLVWEFDLESATEGDWMDQKVFMIWEKKPLYVKLHPVKR